MKKVILRPKNLYIFLIFGSIYINIEVFFKGFKNINIFGLSLIGYTSIWMFLVGGLSALLVGFINEYFSFKLITQCIIGGLIIGLIELFSGIVFNIWLFPHNPLWNYDDMPFNFMGQICLPFIIAWMVLCPCIINLDDFLREHIE